MTRSRHAHFFPRQEGAPAPLSVAVERRVQFREVDLLGIVWHGHYPAFLEEASALLRDRCGLSYAAFREAGLGAPIVQLHLEYFEPLELDECFTVRARLVWCEGARLNVEYEVLKQTGRLAATAYTVQLFIAQGTRQPCMAIPALLQKARDRWRAGTLE